MTTLEVVNYPKVNENDIKKSASLVPKAELNREIENSRGRFTNHTYSKTSFHWIETISGLIEKFNIFREKLPNLENRIFAKFIRKS